MFKNVLDKLGIASKEAVVDGNSNTFDEFKNYMHVDRFMDSLLEDIVLSSISSGKSKLILISGNVGDGKSHLLAKLYKKFPNQMLDVEVRNDATESNFVSKSWIDELNEFLYPFSDAQLQNDNTNTVRIVAINLGVLSRFLAETESFGRLGNFVQEKGILDNLAYENHYHSESHFQFINLADFKLFTLREKSASSLLLETLLKKITQDTDENPFYKTLKEFYTDHPYKSNCIIRFNFFQLESTRFQQGLVSLIIYAIIKFKLIISIRDLLDFIYDLMVPYSYQKLSGEEIKNRDDYHDYSFQVTNSIYNKLFESEGRSALMSAIRKLDPLKLRSEKLDSYIFRMSSSENPTELFTEKEIDFSAHYGKDTTIAQKQDLIKTFVRTLYLNNLGEFNADLEDLHTFSEYLFAYHTGNKDILKPLYKDILKAIQCWNGHAKTENEINVVIGKHQLVYNITQQLKIQVNIKVLEKKETQELHEFETSFDIDIKVSGEIYVFKLDFNLYTLIQKVIKGYCPNRLDREDHIDFQKFVAQITTIASNKTSDMIFEEISGSSRQRFQLSFDESFGYNFNEI
jgi:DNA phosphorothioation-dependent restriction protein DptF